MVTLFLDANTNWNTMATTCKLQEEYQVPSHSTSFEGDLIDLSGFIGHGKFSVVTNLRINEFKPIEYIQNDLLYADDFDVISKIEFKKSSIIKVKLSKSEFNPLVMLD
jgi:hypothetical protein